MYQLKTTKQFEKDYKTCKKRGLQLNHIHEVIELLEQRGALPLKYKTHKLNGQYADFLECHIQSDWLLIWSKDEKMKVIVLTRTGTHSDLF